MSESSKTEEGARPGLLTRKLTNDEVAANAGSKTGELSKSMAQDGVAGADEVNKEPWKYDVDTHSWELFPIQTSRNTVEAVERFDPQRGFGEKEERKLGDPLMRANNMQSDWFICPRCNQKNDWKKFKDYDPLGCRKCGLQLLWNDKSGISLREEETEDQAGEDQGDGDSDWITDSAAT